MGRFIAFALLGALVAIVPVTDSKAQSNGIAVEGAWARPTPGFVKNAAVYFTIVNHGAAADRLVGATSPASDRAETHINIREGDIVRMRRVISVDVPAGGQTVFSPNGFHVMLTGVKAPLKAGEQVPLTLQFANAGAVAVSVTVRN
jgi:periplasmic copper chaperone A